MNRTQLTQSLKWTLAASLLTVSAWASALELKPFSADQLSQLQQQGQPVAVHFHADWCSVCVAQSRSLNTLKADPDLRGMTVLVANYDQERDLRRSMRVRSQSVMVVFKGTQEVGRLGGQSGAQDIKAALAKAL
jgi:thioredoxin-like negative regulator of GroEL